MEFSYLSLRRYFLELGSFRVSKGALDQFGEVLEKFAGDITEESLYIAETNGRKTIKAQDIRNAVLESDINYEM